jgi:hypothetical protein
LFRTAVGIPPQLHSNAILSLKVHLSGAAREQAET